MYLKIECISKNECLLKVNVFLQWMHFKNERILKFNVYQKWM